MIDAVSPSPEETVVEIGPGRGALTRGLLASGANVVAIELDRLLVQELRDQFCAYDNFSVYEEDAITVDFREISARKSQTTETAIYPSAKLVANLPYYISTAILQRLAQQPEVFSSHVLMFQREVVDRISAVPGDSNRGFLTVLVEAGFSVERLFDVPPTSFEPKPKVWSSVVRLVPNNSGIGHHESFRHLLSAAFAQKRKTIRNNLRLVLPNAENCLLSAGIDPRRRAETLTLAEWESLLNTII